MAKRDYDNWLISLEADNFSSFIKVWFAYLASIHEIVLASCSTEESIELGSNENGDSIFLNKFRDNYLTSINIQPSTKSVIERCYQISKEQIIKMYPRRFFVLYYKKINNNPIFNKEPIIIYRDSYKLDVSINNNEMHIGILVEKNAPVANRLKKQYIDFKVPLEPQNQKDLKLVVNSDIFYKNLSNKAHILYKHINIAANTKEYEKVKAKLNTLVQTIIGLLKRENVHSLIYVEKFQTTPSDRDALVWLHEFSYGLRNILFHKVVDPFDKNWIMIAKYTSQALHDIVILNIQKLKSGIHV